MPDLYTYVMSDGLTAVVITKLDESWLEAPEQSHVKIEKVELVVEGGGRYSVTEASLSPGWSPDLTSQSMDTESRDFLQPSRSLRGSGVEKHCAQRTHCL